MKKIRVAILGAGKIGKYHVREFSNLGAEVVAILGSSKQSSSETAKELGGEFNARVRPYHLLEELLGNEYLNAVSICTPPEMHENQIRLCLERGLNVMCEKPLVQTSNNDYKTAEELFNLAEKRRKVLTVNTQWVSLVDYLRKNGNLDNLKNFSIYMEPGKIGIEMLKDHLPHANSILIRLIPEGKAEEIEFLLKTQEAAKVRFNYYTGEKTCAVKYSFKFKVDKPRQIFFSLNGETFKREIGQEYKQVFISSKRRFEINDPLRVSIDRFLEASQGSNTPLVNKNEILENIAITGQIISKYIS